MHDVDHELESQLQSAYDTNGVDRTLVRVTLALSPSERLAALEERMRALQELLAARDAARR